MIQDKTFDQERALYGLDSDIVKNCRFDGPNDGESALKECRRIEVRGCFMNLRYPLWHVADAKITGLKMKGKYSFQYDENIEITNSQLDTKDAFWHTKNVTVKNSIVKGEYLGWYSENLTLINCRIIGTQPFCYCRNLVLENCTMKECDLAFERSTVKAEIKGKIDSIKNPLAGKITADCIGELIIEKEISDKSKTEIICRKGDCGKCA